MVRTLPSILMLRGWLLSSSSPALAGAMESARSQATLSGGRNTIIADSSVKYVGYWAGGTIIVALEYSAGCNIVLRRSSGEERRTPPRPRFALVTLQPRGSEITEPSG